MERKVQEYELEDEAKKSEPSIVDESQQPIDEHPEMNLVLDEGPQEPQNFIVADESEPKEVKRQQHKEEQDPFQQKFDRVKKEKYESLEQKHMALDRVAQLERENEELRRTAEIASQAAMINHDERVKHRLERAKQLKGQAIESGDVQQQVDADLELSMAASELDRLNNWKATQTLQSQYPEPAREMPRPEVLNSREIQHWYQKNPWANPDNDEFDKDLRYEAERAGDQLDNYLIQNGLQHQMYSREYFNEIDNYISQVKRQNPDYEEPSHISHRRAIPMKNSRSPVSSMRGVSSSGVPGASPRKTFTISKEEMELSKQWGLDPKTYVAHRENLRQKGKLGVNKIM